MKKYFQVNKMIYEDIVEENLILELEWLKKEFENIYESKKDNYTKKDNKIANDILDYFLEHTYVNNNIKSLNFLDEVVDNIKQMYPNLL